MSDSKNFIEGITICQKYMTDDTIVNVIKKSSIAITELKCLPKDVVLSLINLGWNAGSKDYGWAEYFKLEYLDV